MQTNHLQTGAMGERPMRAIFLALVMQLAAGCAPLITSPPPAHEQATDAHAPGTLLLGEVIRDLPRDGILARYTTDDLKVAGWTVDEVVDGTAVVLVTHGQMNQSLIHVLYALVPRSMQSTLISHRHPGMRANYTGNSEGGDVASVRVVRPDVDASQRTGLNIVEAVIEAANVTGDCFYSDRGLFRPAAWRHGLYCKSLLGQGWEWDGAEFVKRP